MIYKFLVQIDTARDINAEALRDILQFEFNYKMWPHLIDSFLGVSVIQDEAPARAREATLNDARNITRAALSSRCFCGARLYITTAGPAICKNANHAQDAAHLARQNSRPALPGQL